MPAFAPTQISNQIYAAAKAAFSELIRSHPDQNFYTFGLWTDDSLQFLHAVSNTEEALASTVKRYRETVDPKHGCTSTSAGMRWSYGDWEFFPEVGAKYFAEINEVVRSNFDSDESEFEAGLELLWSAILDGFQRLEKEHFFGSGPQRSKTTLLLVGDLPPALVNQWAAALNPPDVADRLINWDYEAPDEPSEIHRTM
jgi:hypothetical protein